MAGILKMFGIKKINPLSGAAARDIVGIDFSGNAFKLVQMRLSPNKTEVVNLVTRNIAGLSDGDISKIMASSISSLSAKNPHILSIITSNMAITKNIEIPSVSPKEIREIIDLQAGRHTPYARDEIMIDYIDVSTYKNTYTKILLVIVTCNIIKRLFDISAKAGLKLEKVIFAPEALGLSATRALGVDTVNAPVSIVNIDESFTDFTIVYKNKLVFERSIPIGVGQLMMDKDAGGVRFAEELKRSLETYQGENIERSPDFLALTGAVEEMSWLEPVLTETLHMHIRIVPYMKKMAVKSEVLSADPVVGQFSFLNIIASILALGDIKISLIPEEVRLRRSIEERGRELVKTGIFVFSAFLLLCIIFITSISFKTSYLKKLSAKSMAFDKDAKDLENRFETVSLIKNCLSGRGYSLEVLTELHDIAPINLELSDIRFDEQGKISLKGTAESMSDVFSFVELMRKSKYFKDVKTKYTSKRKESSKDLTDFEITAELNKGR